MILTPTSCDWRKTVSVIGKALFSDSCWPMYHVGMKWSTSIWGSLAEDMVRAMLGVLKLKLSLRLSQAIDGCKRLKMLIDSFARCNRAS